MKTLLAVLLLLALGHTPASGQALFSDDFSGDLSRWSIDAPSYWSIADGWMQVHLFNDKISKALVGDPAWSDYRVDFDVVQLSGVDKFCYLRYQDETIGYFVNFRGPVPAENGDPGAVRLFRLNNRNQWPWGSWDLVDFAFFPNNLGTTYHLTIEAVGNRITVWVDGTEMLSFADTVAPVLNGKVGLGGFNGASGGPCQAKWDNFRVTVPAVATETTSWGRVKALFR